MWFLRRQKNKSGDEAREALEEAQQKLEEVQSRGEEITELSASFKRFNERNHFAEKLEELFFQTRKARRAR